MLEWIGWIATAMSACSYFFRQPITLRRIQAGAALLWLAYGLSIRAMPIVAANLIVAAAALYSSFNGRTATREQSAVRDLGAASERPTVAGSSQL